MSNATLLPTDAAQSLSLASAIQSSTAGIVSRTLLQTPEMRTILFSFAAGQELTSHRSSRRALIHILEGTCDFFFNNQWQRLAAGEILHLPPNHPHAVRATDTSFAMLLTLSAEPS